MSAESPLKSRRDRFLNEYLIDLSVKAAAIRAGVARRTAVRWMTTEQWAQDLDIALRERAYRTEITIDRVVEELAKVGFVSAEDMAEYRIRASDKVAALVALGKHLGMFEGKLALSGPNGGALQVTVRRMIVDEAVPHD